MPSHRSTDSNEFDHDEPSTSSPSQQHVEYDPVVFHISSYFKLTLSQLRYITFTIVGIALLWPWNAFLSASAYYGDRFSHSPNLIKIYSSTMMSVSTITSTLYNYYLSQAQAGVSYKFRVNIGLWLTIFVFIFMSISCISDLLIMMDDIAFFSILMIMVLMSAMATCLAQNGTMAIVNVLGGIYANAVMVGQAVAGVLPALALIISILLVGDKKSNSTDEDYHVEKNYGVFVYYITASLISIISILLVYWINHHKVESAYNALNEIAEEEQPLNSSSDIIDEPDIKQKQHVPFSVLWSKLKLIVSTIFLTFSITLIFPVFASTIESVHINSTFWFYRKEIYIPFIYLIWNLGDLLGRILCGYPRLHMIITNPKTLILYSISRLVFIPLFFTCNIHPYTAANQSSAIINSDAWYILLQLLFGISNGQLCTSCFMIVGDFCDTDEEKEAAGGFTSVFLSVGLAAGSVLSYLLVIAID
ncbi:nucleoside transporter-domain-containing protein [Scheffersomyces coipomensis]|uniref:nucleoside transporter-domain-containing protein n=1 Tax=Scheffersomyces coipomensis TaxID=1788519 RepID=UPI00315CE2BE